MELTQAQAALAALPADQAVFLEGPAGTGKTTTGVARLLHLLAEGIPAAGILVMAPQRTLTLPYYDALRRTERDAGGEVTVLTMGGLARRMIDIFWPLIAEPAGFAMPNRRPTFLTLETAQYHMARVMRPLLDKGFFEAVTIDRNRLYSQVLDNLNKAAVVGFPHTEIGARLIEAWSGESSQRHIYEDAQASAEAFRAYCLANNLLDFSLQIDVFMKHLVHHDLCRSYMGRTYRHLIADNIEEDTPTTHDLLAAWLPAFASALLVYDHAAGYRRFLGADPETAYMLKALCGSHAAFEESHVAGADLHALADHIAQSLGQGAPQGAGDPRAALDFAYLRDEEHHPDRPYPRYHTEMLNRVAAEIAHLVHEAGTPPGEIVVLAPFLSDALRFSLRNRLAAWGVEARSHRPSRALRDEPATLCLLTLAALAHPDWRICPSAYEVAYALMQAIGGMDLVRAQLLASIVYRTKEGAPQLGSFDRLNEEAQMRITYVLGERYTHLRGWIRDYIAQEETYPLDHFLSRLFGEVLSQPGFAFHADFDAGGVAASVIESARKFRWVMEAAPDVEVPLGKEYLAMVQEGVIAAQYVARWEDPEPEEGAVFLAPAYTFLMRNRPAMYQFWLNVGSGGWWERLYQPLTHPYVLRRGWEGGPWTDEDEMKTRHATLARVVRGLVRRCRGKVYLGLSELDEQGSAQQGPLLQAVSAMLRRLRTTEEDEENHK